MTEVYVQRALPRWLTVILGVAGTVIALAGMRAGASMLGPILLALVLTIGVHPLSGWLRRKGLPQWLAVLITLLGLFLVLFGFVLALVVSVAQLATVLPDYSTELSGLLDGLRSVLAAAGVGPDQVRDALESIDPSSVVSLITGLLGGVLGALSNLVFLLALVLFMATDATSLPARLSAVPGTSSGLGTALAGFARSTRSYLMVATVFGLVVAVVDAGALWLMGVPLPLLWGLLAFITNYIPNIGFVLGVVPPALLGLLVGGADLLVWVVVVYSVANFVIQTIIQPKYVGDAVGLSLTATFLSLVVWTFVLGPLGAVLAIPLSLLVKAVLVDQDPGSQWAATLLSAAPQQPRAPRRRQPPAEENASDRTPAPAGQVITETSGGAGAPAVGIADADRAATGPPPAPRRP